MKNSSRSRKKSGFSWIRKKRGDETSNGVVRGNQQVSVHEVLKKQQIHEDARKMHRTNNFCQQILENGESVNWEVTTWSEQ